jgi:hypothetical protein
MFPLLSSLVPSLLLSLGPLLLLGLRSCVLLSLGPSLLLSLGPSSLPAESETISPDEPYGCQSEGDLVFPSLLPYRARAHYFWWTPVTFGCQA